MGENVTKQIKQGHVTCQNCGSKNMVKDGKLVQKTGKYQRHKCMDCGSKTKGGKL